MPSPFCHTPYCSNPIENKDTGLCSSCGRAARKEEEALLREPKKRKPIKKVSANHKQLLDIMYKLKAVWIVGKKCGVRGCQLPAVDPHHMKGRGKYLLDTSTWLPVCRDHHTYIENNPDWAKEQGYSLSRLETQKE